MLLDSIEPEDKEDLLKEDSDEIDSKKLTKAISKISKELKNGAIFEDGSYEDIILKINKCNSDLKKKKKEFNDLKKSLDEETVKKIESLTDSEIFDLLKRKWIVPMHKELVNLSTVVLEKIENEVCELAEKYEDTLVNIDNELSSTESRVADYIDDLKGDSFDLAGMKELQKLLRGTKDGKK